MDPGFDSRSGLKAIHRRLLTAWAEGSLARGALGSKASGGDTAGRGSSVEKALV